MRDQEKKSNGKIFKEAFQRKYGESKINVC